MSDDTRTNDELLADVQALVDSLDATTMEIGRQASTVMVRADAWRAFMRPVRARGRRSRMLRSPRRRQQLRTWARETGGRLVATPVKRRTIVGLNPDRRSPASVGPATTEDAQAFTTWLATRERRGLVPDAVPR